MKRLLELKHSYWLVALDFNVHNLWIGLYWKKHHGPRIGLWLIGIPTLCLHVEIVY